MSIRTLVHSSLCLILVMMSWALRAGHMNSDTIPPQVIVSPQNFTILCNTTENVDSLIADWYNNNAGMQVEDDQSDTIIFTAFPDLTTVIQLFNNSGNCDKIVEVSFQAIDDCDNSTESLSAVFSQVDNNGPIINVHASPMMINCTDLVQDSLEMWLSNQGGAMASDECNDFVDWFRFTYQDNLGNSGFGFIGANVIPIPDDICDWRVDVSFIVVDGCGNQSVTTSFFEITDEVLPFFSEMPGDTTLGCEALPLENNVIGIDYCTPEPILNYEEMIIREGTPDSCSFYNFSIVRTWTITDACGNSDIHQQTVNIIDNQPPHFFLLDTVIVDCDDLEDTQADFLPTNVIDNCSTVEVNYNDTQNGSGCSYTIDRIYTFRDVCGNTSQGIQHIIIEDQSPPVIEGFDSDYVVSCQSDIILTFEEWYTGFNDGLNIQDCNNTAFFAAIPGSYDIDDPSTYPGLPPEAIEMTECGSAGDGYLIYREIDFVYYDDCNNATIINGVYGITDDVPPVIQSCVEDQLIEVDSGNCVGVFTLPQLIITDECVETTSPIVSTSTANFSSSDPGNPDVLVTFTKTTFRDISPFFLQIEGDVMLDIEIFNADINDPSEVFIVTTESLDTVGFTNTSGVQCGSSVTTFTFNGNRIAEWLEDGLLEFFLFPLEPSVPSEGINDICENSRIRTTITIPTSNDQLFSKELVVNGISIPDFISNENQIDLDIGVNQIDLIVSDCAGNKDTCNFQVTVIDNEAPLLSCPSDTIINLKHEDDCSLSYTFASLFSVEDNCYLNNEYSQRRPLTDEGSLITFEYLEEYDAYAAQNIILGFNDAFSIINSSQEATLEVSVLAHFDDGSDRIEIKGEDGSTIGFIDEDNASSCDVSVARFNISKEMINEWADDGRIDISFIPLKGIGVSNGGINPCQEIEAEGTDGQSFISALLRYSDAKMSFFVEGATNLDTAVADAIDSIDLELNVGDNLITLIAKDLYGNESTCSYNVVVQDTIAPVVSCKNAVLFLDPSGVNDVVLDPYMIDNGSIDNCGIDSMVVSPSNFNCELLGSEVEVTFTVWDKSGNSSSCITEVMLRTEVLNPTYDLGLCNDDTLRLLANAPPSEIQDVYTFLWTGPDFTSILENPVIPNAGPENNGTYTLEITGFNGCVSMGTVEVNVEELSSPTILVESNGICAGDLLLLSTASQSGDITYSWYEGIFPNGLLIESTEAPNLQIMPNEGDHLYYLQVVKEGCESNPSPAVSVSVTEAPTASVIDEFVTVCEGDPIVIGTEVTGNGINYLWTGPNGYTSDQQYPDTIFNSASNNEGIYSLVLSIGSCISDTAFLQVTLFDKPVTPEILAGDVFCEGSSISLSVNNIPNADLYTWFKDGEQHSTTARNNLLINNASEDISGEWTVLVTEGICNSEPSFPKSIIVESELLISANNDGPGCEGDSVQLSTSFVPGGNYSWTGPQGFESAEQNPRILAVSGDYFVTITTPSGCEGSSSTTVEIVIPPEITALSSDALECMDGMTDIILFPSVFPQGEYRYEWSGSGIEDTTVAQAVIPDATEEDNGIYTLRIFDGTCASQPQDIIIDITTLPAMPTITGKTAYCTGDTLILEAESDESGSFYVWNTPQGQRFTEENKLVFPDIQLEDKGFYSVLIEKGNCRSMVSPSLNIMVSEIPLSPSVSANDPLCSGDTLRLFSTIIRDASYNWTGPNNFVSMDPSPIIPNASDINEGSYSVSVSLGSCTETSRSYEVQLSDRPVTPLAEQDEYSICASFINEGIELCLDEMSFHPDFMYTLYNNSNGEIITTYQERCVRVNDLSGFRPGDNFLFIRSDDGICSSDPSTLINIRIEEVPIIDAEVEGNPIVVCDNDPVLLQSVFGPPEVQVEWEAITPGIQLSSTMGKEIEVTNLGFGENLVLVIYSNMECGRFSSDTVRIILDEIPVARNDNFSFLSTGQVLLPVFDNDLIPSFSTINIVREPLFGQVEVQSDGIYLIPSGAFIGIIDFTYEICGVACDGACDEATVTVSLGDEGDCKAPTIITPNGDGINDAFVVPCLYSDAYPDSKLSVFNQWGTPVYETTNYKNDWEGTYNDKDLPVGTYYYVLDLADGSEPLIGFLIVER